MYFVQGVGVGVHHGAIGKNIQAGEQPKPEVKAVVIRMGVAFGAEQLEG